MYGIRNPKMKLPIPVNIYILKVEIYILQDQFLLHFTVLCVPSVLEAKVKMCKIQNPACKPGDLSAKSSRLFLLASMHCKDLFQFFNKPETRFKIMLIIHVYSCSQTIKTIVSKKFKVKK